MTTHTRVLAGGVKVQMKASGDVVIVPATITVDNHPRALERYLARRLLTVTPQLRPALVILQASMRREREIPDRLPEGGGQ